MTNEAYDKFTRAIVDLAGAIGTSQAEFDAVVREQGKARTAAHLTRFLGLPAELPDDLSKVTFACFGVPASELIPIDFELPDTTDMVTIEHDAGEADEPFDPDPPFEIDLVVFDVVDDQDVALRLAPKADMSPREAFWLSVFERHYAERGDDSASGSVLEWLRKRDLLRHFETV